MAPATPTLASPSSAQPLPVYKIVLIGDAGVGKTALRQRYLDDKFSHAYRATLGADFASRVIAIPSAPNAPSNRPTHVRAQLWDTAGSERFRALGSAFYRGADACILVYSATNRESLDALPTWFNEFVNKRPVKFGQEDKFVWACAGCKIDLLDEVESGRRRQSSGWSQHDAMTGKSGLEASESEVKVVLESLIPNTCTTQSGSVENGVAQDNGDVDAKRLIDKSQLPDKIPPGYTVPEAAVEMRHERPVQCSGINGSPRRSPSSTAIEPSLALPSQGATPRTTMRVGDRSQGTMAISSASESTVLSIYHTPPSSVSSRRRRRRLQRQRRSLDPSQLTSGESEGETEYEDGIDYDEDGDAISVTSSSKSGGSTASVGTITATTQQHISGPTTHTVNDSNTLTSTTKPPTTTDSTPRTHKPSSIPLFLTSSLTGQNVEDLFTHVAYACLLRDERLRRQQRRRRLRQNRHRIASQTIMNGHQRNGFSQHMTDDDDEDEEESDDLDDGEDVQADWNEDEEFGDDGQEAARGRDEATIQLKKSQLKSERKLWRRCC